MNGSPSANFALPQSLALGEGKADFRTTINGRAEGLLARTGSLSGHPSKQQPRFVQLSCDNRRIHCTAPLAKPLRCDGFEYKTLQGLV
ncbi:hypothetical protein J6590_026265 [Homalodisca vitripennis]|nr:hypothetical protein J6590_026265 [Homalodisca vitripennis]